MSKTKNYGELNDELTEIIEKMQSSELDVDQVVKEYEKAEVLISQLELYLKSARNKITTMTTRNPKSDK